jgi:hypothetical protein
MPSESARARLRQIRDLKLAMQNLAQELDSERDRLIREATEDGATQGALEIDTGLDQSVISRILMRDA